MHDLKMEFLVACKTPYGIVYLNPLHIVAIEPPTATNTYLHPTAKDTTIRVSTTIATTIGETGLAYTTTEPTAAVAGRVETALRHFHI